MALVTEKKKKYLGRKKILIIEDELPLLGLLRDTFRAERFAVCTASTGREGLATAFRERPDLVILDVLMPGMSGLAVLKRLRRDRFKWGKYVPVIILSNLSNPETVSEGTKHGADYLVKADWSLHDLVLKAKEKLNHNGRSAPDVAAH